MLLHTRPTDRVGQCLEYCHDDMHVDGDSCPTCNGWRTSCAACTPDHIKAKRHAEKMRARQTSSATAKTATPSSAEAEAPGREVEPHSPAVPSRPGAVPERIAVVLPVGRIATATTHDGESFQPDTVTWEAFITRFDVIVTAWVHGCDRGLVQMFDPAGSLPRWLPARPAWFAAEVARMRDVVAQEAYDVRLEKLIDRAGDR